MTGNIVGEKPPAITKLFQLELVQKSDNHNSRTWETGQFKVPQIRWPKRQQSCGLLNINYESSRLTCQMKPFMMFKIFSAMSRCNLIFEVMRYNHDRIHASWRNIWFGEVPISKWVFLLTTAGMHMSTTNFLHKSKCHPTSCKFISHYFRLICQKEAEYVLQNIACSSWRLAMSLPLSGFIE